MSSSGSSGAGDEFVEARCRLSVHLHPSRLANVREGVEEQINAHVMKYVDALDGVLLAYSDLTLAEDPARNPLHCGFIFQERSFIHFDVSLRALTWRCAAGAVYEGVVNAVAADHVSILLHGIFTATIPLSGAQVPRGWQWDAEQERWLDTSVWSAAAEAAASAAALAVKDEESDDEGAAEQAAAAGKKLSKKELKKLERKKLRAVMLAAQGRTGGSAHAEIKAPAAGVIARGVHLRFECTLVQHSDEGYLKLTGTLVPTAAVAKPSKAGKSSKAAAAPAAAEPLGLTGGFTPLAPLEGSATAAAAAAVPSDEEQQLAVVQEEDVDMEAIAAVTAFTGGKTAAPMPTPAPAAPAAPATPAAPKQLTAGQAERAAKKKAKLAERMAAKGAGADGAAEAELQSPAKKQKTASAPSVPPPTTDKKKSKKVKSES